MWFEGRPGEVANVCPMCRTEVEGDLNKFVHYNLFVTNYYLPYYADVGLSRREKGTRSRGQQRDCVR